MMTRSETPFPVETPTSAPLSREEVRGLLEPRPGPCLSIFLPTVRAGAETQQNPIRWKNLLRAVEAQLGERGLRKPEIEELLEPLRALQEDQDFWQHQSEGLAVFRAPDLLRAYRLPLPFEELAAVEDRFHLKPLFPFFDGDGKFYVLALAMHDVRLFEGSRWSVQEVDLPGVPRTVEAAVGEELGQKPLPFSLSGPGAPRVRHGAPAFHAHGASEDDTKTALHQFFKRVDTGLQELPIDRQVPLVLAGVDYLLPIYREATLHPHLVAEGVLGNPEILRPEELHAAAWKLVEPLFLERRRRAAERYRELTGTGLASGQLDLVLGAADDGRVESLFTPVGVRCWGRWDPAERMARIDGGGSEPGPGKEDLLDRAAIQTFLHGGEVFAVPAEEVPEKEGSLAAVFRW